MLERSSLRENLPELARVRRRASVCVGEREWVSVTKRKRDVGAVCFGERECGLCVEDRERERDKRQRSCVRWRERECGVCSGERETEGLCMRLRKKVLVSSLFSNCN